MRTAPIDSSGATTSRRPSRIAPRARFSGRWSTTGREVPCLTVRADSEPAAAHAAGAVRINEPDSGRRQRRSGRPAVREALLGSQDTGAVSTRLSFRSAAAGPSSESDPPGGSRATTPPPRTLRPMTGREPDDPFWADASDSFEGRAEGERAAVGHVLGHRADGCTRSVRQIGG